MRKGAASRHGYSRLQPELTVDRHVLEIELRLHCRLTEDRRELGLFIARSEDEIAREQKSGFDHSAPTRHVDHILRDERMILAAHGESRDAEQCPPGVGVAELL